MAIYKSKELKSMYNCPEAKLELLKRKVIFTKSKTFTGKKLDINGNYTAVSSEEEIKKCKQLSQF